MSVNPEEMYMAFEVEVRHPKVRRVSYEVMRWATEVCFYDERGEWCGSLNIARSALPRPGHRWTVKELPGGRVHSFDVVRILGRPRVGVAR